MMQHSAIRGLQTGVVLTIALLLLLVLTLLTVASLHGAGIELALAGNEKYRQQAAAAAEVGIETALAGLPAATLSGSPVNAELVVDASQERRPDRAQISTRYFGDISLVPGFSAGRFIGRSFEIRSIGTSIRAARAERIQGAVRIDAADAAFTPLPPG
jgi:type II secretory pathway component PulK